MHRVQGRIRTLDAWDNGACAGSLVIIVMGLIRRADDGSRGAVRLVPRVVVVVGLPEHAGKLAAAFFIAHRRGRAGTVAGQGGGVLAGQGAAGANVARGDALLGIPPHEGADDVEAAKDDAEHARGQDELGKRAVKGVRVVPLLVE